MSLHTFAHVRARICTPTQACKSVRMCVHSKGELCAVCVQEIAVRVCVFLCVERECCVCVCVHGARDVEMCLCVRMCWCMCVRVYVRMCECVNVYVYV